MLTVTTPLISKAIGNPGQAIAFALNQGAARPEEVARLIQDYYLLGEMTGVNADFMAAAAHHETGGYKNRWWKERLNAGSLGVTGSPSQDEASPTFTTPEAASAAHVAHILLYATGKIDRGGLTPADDPRYQAYRNAYGNVAKATTIGGLSGTYAEDTKYGPKIVALAALIFPGGPVTDTDVTFGRVPNPVNKIAIVKKAGPGNGYSAVPPRQIVGACDHITDGDPGGNNDGQWYSDFFGVGGERAKNALVDYVIDRLGVITILNDPWGTRSPWANGGSDGLEGDGPLFIRTFGVNGVNDRLASIEHVGVAPAAMTDVQLEASAKLKAYIFDRAGVPWNKFPLHPKFGVVTHLQHFEFATKSCPAAGIIGQTNRLQDRIRAIMKKFQTGATVPTQPPVEPPNPDHEQFGPYDLDALIARFADLRRVDYLNNDGVEEVFHFDKQGAVTNAWVGRGIKEKLTVEQLPVPDDWFVVGSEFTPRIDVVSFGGNVWNLQQNDPRAGFRWTK